MFSPSCLFTILIAYTAAQDLGAEDRTLASAQSVSLDATPPRTIWSNPFGPGPEVLPSTLSASSASASSTTTLPNTILSGAAGSSGTSAPFPTTTVTITRVYTDAQGGLSTQVNPTRPATPPGRPEQGLPPQMCDSVSECGTESSTASSASGGHTMGVAKGGS